ncbi:hypothetical protein Misp01_49920 [Microtetraspora sp. NBRC 13810]|nr:hypothetical protein Misp01_49920 [Microtetraspora sp. NBRC 13810]
MGVRLRGGPRCGALPVSAVSFLVSNPGFGGFAGAVGVRAAYRVLLRTMAFRLFFQVGRDS